MKARLQQGTWCRPAEDQAPVARRARRLASIRPAADLAEEEFKNVWNAVESDLKGGPSRTSTTEEKAREPGDCRPAGPPRAGAGGDRRQEQHLGDRRRDHAFDRRAHASVSGPRAGNLGALPKNPAAVAGVRAPIFEEKVVDFLIELATVTDKRSPARSSTRTTKTAPRPPERHCVVNSNRGDRAMGRLSNLARNRWRLWSGLRCSFCGRRSDSVGRLVPAHPLISVTSASPNVSRCWSNTAASRRHPQRAAEAGNHARSRRYLHEHPGPDGGRADQPRRARL